MFLIFKKKNLKSLLGVNKTNLKTIWSKFNVQMKNLMLELAEPLLDMGEIKKKKKSSL